MILHAIEVTMPEDRSDFQKVNITVYCYPDEVARLCEMMRATIRGEHSGQYGGPGYAPDEERRVEYKDGKQFRADLLRALPPKRQR